MKRVPETTSGGDAVQRGPKLRKLYHSIGEVSEIFGVPPHVLRYWEQEFPQLRPKKNVRSGIRLYREKDLESIERIKHLLYDQRFTIAGAKSQLSLLDVEEVEATRLGEEGPAGLLAEVRQELQEILNLLNS